MFVKTANYQVSYADFRGNSGGVNEILLKEAENGLNRIVLEIENAGDEIKDIKVNHFNVINAESGACNEVWVQYTILCTNSKGRS